MATTFTFFKRKTLSRAVLVFPGELEDKPEIDSHIRPLYTIDSHTRHYTLLEHSADETHDVLSGKIEGLLGRSAVITGDCFLSTAKRSSIIKDGWKFVHMSDTFTWHVNWRSTQWTLRDLNKRELARFERKSFKVTKSGTLYLLQPMDKDLLTLTILTCEIVHRDIKTRERAASGGS
ncbi:hypothetical protein GGF46_000397 [Coemansia sp. RSA 552]|nr:hypothetical protein GGF46_000397 [Coemansia sp. RSA 552]